MRIVTVDQPFVLTAVIRIEMIDACLVTISRERCSACQPVDEMALLSFTETCEGSVISITCARGPGHDFGRIEVAVANGPTANWSV